MSGHRFPGQVLKKSSLFLLLALLVFQSFGINGLAASADLQTNFLQGDNPQQSLTCSLPGLDQTPTFCNIQIVLMIDDSGSMTTNDPQTGNQGGFRNQGAKHVVDLLATSYYLPAVQLIDQLNQENPDLNLQYPVVQVAVIHFSRGVKNANVQWVNIDPSSLEQWNTDNVSQKKALYDLIDLQYARLYQLTSFVEPFATARELFGYSKPSGDCTRRSIMLFTDGAPEDAGGRLTGDALEAQMNELGRITNEIQGNLPEDQKVEVYITGFNKSPTYLDYWRENVQPLWWQRVIGVEQAEGEGQNEPRQVKLLEGEDYRIELLNRMEQILGKSAGLRIESVDESKPFDVPNHVQTLRLTLFNLDPTATLEITANGQVVSADDNNVVVARNVPAIEVWEINNPMAGSYQVQATKPGGVITALLTYQNLSVEFNPEPARLQVAEPSEFKFKLMDSAGMVVLPDADPKLELKVDVTQNSQTEPLPWTMDGDEYQVSWTPPATGDAEFSVEANLVGDDNNALLNCKGTVATLPVDPPSPKPTLAIGTPDPSCVPPGEVITVPVQLDYAGEDRSWVDSLDWDVSATADGKSVRAGIEPVDVNRGDYLVTIDPVDAEEVQLSVRADAVIDGQAVEVSAGAPITMQMCSTSEGFPFWLIFIWLLMGLFFLFLGWVFLYGGNVNIQVNIQIAILAALELVLAVVWFIVFGVYRTYLLWMLLLFAFLLLLLLFIKRREIKEGATWWLIIVLTLYILIWFVVFGRLPFWLFLLLLLMWLGILIVAWMMWRERSPRIPWLLLVLLLVLAVISIMYFGAYWLFLLLWLLVTLVLLLVILVIGPFFPGRTVYIYSDYFTLIEGIGDDVEKILNDHGVRTFSELAAYADRVDVLKGWLRAKGFPYSSMDPTTWPEQARLAEEAKQTGDWTEFIDLVDELRIGRVREKPKGSGKGSASRPSGRAKKSGGGKGSPKKSR